MIDRFADEHGVVVVYGATCGACGGHLSPPETGSGGLRAHRDFVPAATWPVVVVDAVALRAAAPRHLPLPRRLDGVRVATCGPVWFQLGGD